MLIKVVVISGTSIQTLITTVMSRSHPYVDRLKMRSDVKLIKVTKENRKELALNLIEEFKFNVV